MALMMMMMMMIADDGIWVPMIEVVHKRQDRSL